MTGKFRFGVFVVFVVVVVFFFFFFFFSGVGRAQSPVVPQRAVAYTVVHKDLVTSVVRDVAVPAENIVPAKAEAVHAKADVIIRIGHDYTVDGQNVIAQQNVVNAVWNTKQSAVVYKHVPVRSNYSGNDVVSEIPLNTLPVAAHVKSVVENVNEGDVVNNLVGVVNVRVGINENYVAVV